MIAEREQQISILASVISEYVLDNGIADAEDAKTVADRIYKTGFRMTDLDRGIEQRINHIEQRLSAIEGWCGLSRHMILT